MKFSVDTHTHTVNSGHAFSTLMENVRAAVDVGLEGICLTEHGPAMPGGPVWFYFGTFEIVPGEIDGVRIFMGVEANIVDYYGTLDVNEKYLGRLSYVLASLHDVCLNPATKEQHTAATLAALENKYVDVIAHPGNPAFDVDREAVVLAAKKHNKLIEINNHSFTYRKGCYANCVDFVRLCKKHSVRIAVASDAHICFEIGRFDKACEILKQESFPYELIVNRSLKSFEEFLEERSRRITTL
ncbi:MAG: phosphatase [Christensenellales bacterium]